MKYPILKNRMDLIRSLIQDKSVLDLGCVDHDLKQVQGSWMHRELARHAKFILGVDYLSEAVEQLRKQGFNVICQNVESLKLNQKFDIIVAGELIEHLNNPGLFLKGVYEHLEKNGMFILTTPNPFSIAQFFKILKHNRIKVNREHTLWLDPKTISVLLKNHHFKIREIYWLKDFKRFPLRSLWARLRSYFHDGFLVLCEKEE